MRSLGVERRGPHVLDGFAPMKKCRGNFIAMLKTKKSRAGMVALLASTGLSMVALAAPAAAQETCTPFADGGYYCYSPADNQGDQNSNGFGHAGISDGAYSNIDDKIELLTPDDADVEAAQTAVDDAGDTLADASDDVADVSATLTDANLAAVDVVAAATEDADAASDAFSAAFVAAGDSNAAFNVAADDLTDANVALGGANADLATAAAGVTAAQTTYDNNQTTANLALLNDALAVQAEAAVDVGDATADRDTALAAANAASADLTAATAAASDAKI